MTDKTKLTDKQKLELALVNTKNLEKRVIELELQMASALKGIRVLTEEKAKEKDPHFKMHENVKA